MIGWRRIATAVATAMAFSAALGVAAAVHADPLPDPAGFYHITPAGIGAGYQAYFALYENSTWRAGDQYQCIEDGTPNRETILGRSGTWLRQGTSLVLIEEERRVMRGGTCRCDAIGCAIEGGTRTEEHRSHSITVDQRAACASAHDPVTMIGRPLPCLTIEGTGYFRLGRAEELLP